MYVNYSTLILCQMICLSFYLVCFEEQIFNVEFISLPVLWLILLVPCLRDPSLPKYLREVLLYFLQKIKFIFSNLSSQFVQN